QDAFVAKVKTDGSGFVYAGYVGGSQLEFGYGIALDGAGSAYVVGRTQSSEATFPVAVGPGLTYGGAQDSFVVKVKPDGTGLAYSSYIGRTASDGAFGVAADAAGSAYVTGLTYSTEASFPVPVGPDLTFNG